MPRGSNYNNSKVENTIVKIVALEEEINTSIDRLVEFKKELIEVIDKVSDPQGRLLLNLRYLNFCTWEEIAVKMGYSIRNVHIIHSKVLDDVKVP